MGTEVGEHANGRTSSCCAGPASYAFSFAGGRKGGGCTGTESHVSALHDIGNHRPAPDHEPANGVDGKIVGSVHPIGRPGYGRLINGRENALL